jgi:hypothetical protein
MQKDEFAVSVSRLFTQSNGLWSEVLAGPANPGGRLHNQSPMDRERVAICQTPATPLKIDEPTEADIDP